MAKQTLKGSPLFDSVRISVTYATSMVCDGWGSLKTPKGTYASTLRTKVINQEKEVLETLTGGVWTQFTSSSYRDTVYDWYAAGNELPLLELPQGRTPGTYNATFYDAVPFATGLEDNTLQATELRVCPNPAKDVFLLQGAQQLLQLTHSSGTQMDYETMSLPNGIQVRMPHAPKGVYLAQVQQGLQVKMLKIVNREGGCVRKVSTFFREGYTAFESYPSNVTSKTNYDRT